MATVEEAVAVIEAGGCAVLPEGACKQAEQVVAKVAGKKVARDRVRIAKMGRLG